MSFKIGPFPISDEQQSLINWFSNFFNRFTGSDGSPIFIKDIGPKDMDADSTIVINLGTIPAKKIVKVSFIIFNDDQDKSYEASLIRDGIDDCVIDYSAQTITITRTAGGFFDTTDFDDTNVNRGRVMIWT
jgi:hypothetical protein